MFYILFLWVKVLPVTVVLSVCLFVCLFAILPFCSPSSVHTSSILKYIYVYAQCHSSTRVYNCINIVVGSRNIIISRMKSVTVVVECEFCFICTHRNYYIITYGDGMVGILYNMIIIFCCDVGFFGKRFDRRIIDEKQ